jgi:hypothetical protein
MTPLCSASQCMALAVARFVATRTRFRVLMLKLSNFLPEAGRGCHIAHRATEPWLLGGERYRRSDYEPGAVLPDIALCEESGLLTAVNTSSDSSRVFYISTRHECRAGDGSVLQAVRSMRSG